MSLLIIDVIYGYTVELNTFNRIFAKRVLGQTFTDRRSVRSLIQMVEKIKSIKK
jgi:hypothetical protein